MMRAADKDLVSDEALRFDIGHLTLPWLTCYERTQFTESLRGELERLTAKLGMGLAAAMEATRIDRLDLTCVRANTSPQELGRKVAAGIIERLAGPTGVRANV
jgi:hypothetical protein